MTVIVAEHCSKWYGDVLGVSDVSWTFAGGVVGLLGRNGAGKSTLIEITSGLVAPSRGALTVFGATPFTDADVRRRIGYAPQLERTWDDLTARQLVTAMAELAGLDRRRAREAAEAALVRMGLRDAIDRRVRGFSTGMRQRVKLATAIAHDPELLILDEPFTGVDPVARVEIIAQLRALADAGTSVVISSHVLYEIEALTRAIVVIDRGRIVADGDVHELRALMSRRPLRICVECDRPRVLAGALAGAEHVERLTFEPSALAIETTDPDRCYDEIAAAVVASGVRVTAMISPDDSLGAVFAYLTGADDVNRELARAPARASATAAAYRDRA